ncbi:MAG: DUF4340 domain-containing protein [Desulfobacterales bacterium]|nr:DUF4340 domain-containing protein [Desulfobacterales bacterium]
MKLKKEYIILGAVIIGVSLYLGLHNANRTHYRMPNLAEIDGKYISKIEIGNAGEFFTLDKKDNTWYIGPEQYPADTEKIKNMLDVIESLTVTALVSESKNYIRYDLNDEKKIAVKAWSGSTLSREFDIGKAAQTYQHTHIMLAGDSNVYHARGDFRRKFDQTIANLRDKTVLSFEQNEIRKIEFKKDNEILLVLERKEIPIVKAKEKDAEGTPPASTESKIIWQDAEEKSVDETKVRQLLTTLSSLTCETYINNSKKEDFKNPLLTFNLKGTQEYFLSIFPKTDKDAKSYPAVSSGNTYPFLLPDHRIDNMKTTIDEI